MLGDAEDAKRFAAAQQRIRTLASQHIGDAVDVLHLTGESLDNVVVRHQFKGISEDGDEAEEVERGACQGERSTPSCFKYGGMHLEFQVCFALRMAHHSRLGGML